ncbi:efflux RND transporter permease subunit [Simiduia litorea]|uniref:efflux RND transporter permease subunit n=1 Tax=Simiduia litorea TaxID=1435348 RepID=UPI0036F2318C
MNILKSAVSRSRATLSILVLILLVGVFARITMTVEANPNIQVPYIFVQVYLDGVSPEDGARLLVRPLEKELRTVEGVDEIIATSRESISYLLVKFEADEDPHRALRETRVAVDRAKAELPPAAEEPVVKELAATPMPAIVLTLAGDGASERSIYRTAKKLQRQIENMPTVLNANLVGYREEMVEVIVDPAQLEHYRITATELANAVVNNNRLVPAGEMDTGKGRFSIKVPGLIETAADVRTLPIKSTAQGVVTLGDVTDIRRTFKDASRFTTVNGKRAMTIEVEKRNGANSTDVAEGVRALAEATRPELPPGVSLGFVLDQSEFTRSMVSEMEGNIVTAMALVMIIVVAALGFRSGALVGFGIPFSLLFATIVVSLIGFSFNFMVMFGMLLALGMLIDGAIVITEFADRKMAEGLTSRVAYEIAVKRMFWPVVASTATTLAAFLPIMFWPGVAGQFMRYLPVTVFAVLVGSLIYALFFAPVLGSLMGRTKMSQKVQDYLKSLERESPLTLSGITGAYARLLHRVMRWPVLMAIGTFAVLYLIFNVYGAFNAGVEFFTETEEKYGTVAVRAQGNFSVYEMDELVSEVEQRVMNIDGVHVVYTATGAGSSSQAGNRESSKDQIGTMLVELRDPATLGRSSHDVFREIREKTADIPGVKVAADAFEGGPTQGKPIQIQLESINSEKLMVATRQLRDRLEKEFPGLRDVVDTSPLPGIEWEMKVDRAVAAQLGVNMIDVGHAVSLVTSGVKVSEYRPDDADDEVDIRVRFPLDARGVGVLNTLRVTSANGPVPMSSFVTPIAKPKVDKVQRNNGIEFMTVKADVQAGENVDQQVSLIQAWLKDNPLDPEVQAAFRGTNEEQAKSLQFLGVAFSLALFLMFIILVTQFNSFYQAFLILSAVVMSTAGVLLGLLITQSTFSVILTGVGIVALAGIVVNNNIVLIDTYNYVRAKNPDMLPIDAIVSACAQRLRPVFLTTATTVLGLLPIAINMSVDLIGRHVVMGGVIASFWVPLASAIVYGLVFSTLLTLLVTPAMLLVPARLKYLFVAFSGRVRKQPSITTADTHA